MPSDRQDASSAASPSPRVTCWICGKKLRKLDKAPRALCGVCATRVYGPKPPVQAALMKEDEKPVGSIPGSIRGRSTDTLVSHRLPGARVSRQEPTAAQDREWVEFSCGHRWQGVFRDPPTSCPICEQPAAKFGESDAGPGEASSIRQPDSPIQPSAAQGRRWWDDKWSWQVTAIFCACGVVFPAAVGLIAAWLSGQL